MSESTRLIGVDVGGTFTDVMAIDNGEVIAIKVPTDVTTSETSVLRGAEGVGVDRASVFNLATTAGLNAVITRRLPKVAFLTTIGHRDILDRGRLWRPFEALTDPSWRREFGDARRPLVPRYLRRGVQERVTSDGAVLIPLDEDQARAQLDVLAECGVEGVAICLLHSFTNPVHEIRLRELVFEVLGDVTCSISSDASPLAKEYPRASTTVIDLLMKMKYTAYTERLNSGLADLGFDGEFNYADCSAMLMPASYALERAHRLVVGGPAAGTAACAHFGEFIGRSNLLCADVGGTSCDISVVLDGKPWVNDTYELEWDLVVNALATEIVTLGAGGGSVVAIGRSGEVLVGPDSAGAEPGPACYGKGGERPTLTDAALSMGILSSDRLLGGELALSPDLAVASFEQLTTPLSLSDRIRQAWMIGLHNIAEGVMEITIRRGIDPRDFSLVAYGAAGPMLLPGILELLPLESVIVPPHPGGFSALGLLSSDRVFSETKTNYGLLEADIGPRLSALFAEMETDIVARARLSADECTVIRSFDARLLGQGWETPFIPVPDGEIDGPAIEIMIANFHTEYQKRGGVPFMQFPVEGVSYRVQVVAPSPTVQYSKLDEREGPLTPSGDFMLRHLYGPEVPATVYERSSLALGDVVRGPAVLSETLSTTFIPKDRTGTVGSYGEVVIA